MTPPDRLSPSLLPEPRAVPPGLSSWLDCLRWFAAMMVCISHVRSVVLADYAGGANLFVRAFYWIHGFGHQAVVVFFVLSGYLVGGEVVRALHRDSFDWRVYVVRRVSRLYLVYAAALLLGGLWDNLGLDFFNVHGIYNANAELFPMIYYSVADRLSLPILAGNVIFCQTLLVPPLGSNTPLWSLANEAWYYALFPLALWPCFTAGRLALRWFCLAAFVAGCLFLRTDILPYFYLWLLGVAPHFASRHRLVPLGIVAPLLFALLVAIRFRWLPASTGYWQDVAIAALLALGLNALERLPAFAAPGPRALHRSLAGFSYSLYLVHWPLALFISAVLEQNFSSGYRLPFGGRSLAIYLAILAFIYGFAWLLAQGTEKHTAPVRDWLLARTGGLPTRAH